MIDLPLVLTSFSVQMASIVPKLVTTAAQTESTRVGQVRVAAPDNQCVQGLGTVAVQMDHTRVRRAEAVACKESECSIDDSFLLLLDQLITLRHNCAPSGGSCCGAGYCRVGETCCGAGCAPEGGVCCGNEASCPSGSKCCEDEDGEKYCAAKCVPSLIFPYVEGLLDEVWCPP